MPRLSLLKHRPLLTRVALFGCGLLASAALCAQGLPAKKAPSARTLPLQQVQVQAQQPAAMPAPALAPPVNAHELQLQAIRQALLEATLQTPTQVISTSWVDANGALQESQQFNSRAEVRKVQLLPWMRAEEDEAPKPQVSAEVLPWGWRRDAKAQTSATCEPPPRAWRTPLSVSALQAPGFAGEQQAAGQRLTQALQQQLMAVIQQGQRWTPAVQAAYIRNTYERALLAPPPEASGGWQAQLRLEPMAVDGKGPAFWKSWLGPTPWVWNLHLSLRPQGVPTDAPASWQQNWRIEVSAEQFNRPPVQWQPALEAQLVGQMAQWLAQAETQLRCEPAQFAVHSDASRALRLLASQDSGLRTGDRVLILQPGWVPSRLLDPVAAEHLALAEVVRLGNRHTEIRQLAGPPLPPGGQWVALPL